VIDSNHVQLASDRGDITFEVGDCPFIVHEWEEIDTALALDEMVRPQAPIIEIPGDRVATKEAIVLIQGRAQPGSMVVMYSSDGHLGQTLANAQGHFEYGFQSLLENGYEIWAMSTGPRGTTSSESNQIYLEFDRTPPNPAKPEPNRIYHQVTKTPSSPYFFSVRLSSRRSRLCIFVPLWLIFLLRKQEFTR